MSSKYLMTPDKMVSFKKRIKPKVERSEILSLKIPNGNVRKMFYILTKKNKELETKIKKLVLGLEEQKKVISARDLEIEKMLELVKVNAQYQFNINMVLESHNKSINALLEK